MLMCGVEEEMSVGLQGSWRFFSFTRIHFQLVWASILLMLYIRALESRSLVILVGQLYTVIFNPCFATDRRRRYGRSREGLTFS
jgi:hypothetical protein